MHLKIVLACQDYEQLRAASLLPNSLNIDFSSAPLISICSVSRKKMDELQDPNYEEK